MSKDNGDVEPDDPHITIRLRPEFAVYVLSSLEVLHDVLDQTTGPDANLNEQARVSALEILCREIAEALSDERSRDQIDSITNELIERFTS